MQTTRVFFLMQAIFMLEKGDAANRRHATIAQEQCLFQATVAQG
jgi:hypothetical protein